MSPVELHLIRKGFENRMVLTDLSFVFNENLVTAILGKSGSGKSTLLKIINGTVKPDQGRVTLFGQPIDYTHIQSVRLQMGYVVQQVGLFPHMDVQSNIDILGRVNHQQSNLNYPRVQQLMDMVDLPLSYITKYPFELSGGEQQRVGLCRAMFLNPPVLLMDEPFGSLDYESKRNIYRHLLAIQAREPRTIILVTHDWDEAITLADRFMWIKERGIKAEGDKLALIELKNSMF